MKLHWLTNNNPNLQEKMRYFSDYFVFVNQWLGRLPGVPFDNPQSLIHKIIYQLENNIQRAPGYFENHYKQLIRFYQPFLISHYPAFAEIETLYSAYNQCPAKETPRVKWLIDHPDLLDRLKSLEQIFERELFEKMFLLIVKYIKCSHPLSEHKTDLEFCTQVLVSLFRLNGHSEKQVAKYIDRILSSSIYDVPLDLEMYDEEKNEAFRTEAQDFIRNRDFDKQFKGLENLMINRKKRKGLFIFAIDDVVLHEKLKANFKHTIDKVTFIIPTHTELKSLRKSVRENDKTSAYKMHSLFFGKNKLLCFIETTFETKKDASFEAMKAIEPELLLLNLYLDTKLVIKPKNFLWVNKIGSDLWSGSRDLMKVKIEHISEMDWKLFQENPFDLLKEKDFEGKLHFLQNEKTFAKAMTEKDLSSFWQYVENLFWLQNTPNKAIQDKFTGILLQTIHRFKGDFLLGIGHLCHPYELDSFADEVTSDKDLLKQLQNALCDKYHHAFDFSPYLPVIKHTFLNSMMTLSHEVAATNYKQEWKEYFASIILELYEYRNVLLHSGQVNPYSNIKMNDLVPDIINNGRWGVIDACLTMDNKTFNQILEALSR